MQHGLLGDTSDFENIEKWMCQSPSWNNTLRINIRDFPGAGSLIHPLMKQLEALKSAIRYVESQGYTEYNLLCFSQGALLCRAALQLLPDLHVDTAVLLSGPQSGEFGFPTGIVPGAQWINVLGNVTVGAAWRIFYTKFAQSELSLANFWNDPHRHSEYVSRNTFLPLLNGEIPDHPDLPRLKRNLLTNAKRIVLIGGKDDDIICPPLSSLFEFWTPEQQGKGPTTPMQKRDIYTKDLIGLRTLDEEKRLFLHRIDGIKHLQWISTRSVWTDVMEPYLVGLW